MTESNGTKVIVTTSWDDGHPLDVRLAELLSSYNILGTFYIPLNPLNCKDLHLPVIARKELHILHNMGMEIGSHTLNHPKLTNIEKNQVVKELTESKEILEDILGEPILSLGYPQGEFNQTICLLAKEAGYRLARTTLAFRTGLEFNPFSMPVSLQFFPHTLSNHIKIALKQGNAEGVINWCRFWKMESELIRLSELVFNHVLRHGGVFHIWGHSWEIEEFNLWESLERVLEHISNRKGVLYLTNSQVLDLASR